MATRFCIAEVGLPLADEATSSDEVIGERLEALVELIAACWDERQEVCRSSGLDVLDVVPGVPLCELMYQPGRLDRVLQGALQQTLNRCRCWDAGDNEAEAPTEVCIDSVAVNAPSVGWAHAQTQSGRAVACLQVGPSTDGPRIVEADGQSTRLYFLSCAIEPPRRDFYRTIPEQEDLSEQDYIVHAPLLFPDLFFKPGLDQEFRRFAGGYRAVRAEVTRHLATLNDHFRRVFDTHRGQVDPIARELQARYHVNMSGESPNTKGNAAAWKERKISIQGTEIYCELHLKLSPTANRIHFHPGHPAIARGKVIVGIFHEHLPT